MRVGSRNAAKLEAVRRGLAPFFGRVEIEATDVASGVDPQPLGFGEIVAGARKRARGAHRAGACDLAAGIEDGLVEIAETSTGWVNIGCCVLFDGAREAIGFTAGFEYPPACVRRRPLGREHRSVTPSTRSTARPRGSPIPARRRGTSAASAAARSRARTTARKR